MEGLYHLLILRSIPKYWWEGRTGCCLVCHDGELRLCGLQVDGGIGSTRAIRAATRTTLDPLAAVRLVPLHPRRERSSRHGVHLRERRLRLGNRRGIRRVAGPDP